MAIIEPVYGLRQEPPTIAPYEYILDGADWEYFDVGLIGYRYNVFSLWDGTVPDLSVIMSHSFDDDDISLESTFQGFLISNLINFSIKALGRITLDQTIEVRNITEPYDKSITDFSTLTTELISISVSSYESEIFQSSITFSEEFNAQIKNTYPAPIVGYGLLYTVNSTVTATGAGYSEILATMNIGPEIATPINPNTSSRFFIKYDEP